MPNPRSSPARLAAVKAGFRSAFEQGVDAQLRQAGVEYTYEKRRIAYLPSGKLRYYKADFECAGRIIIEAKGLFTAADRTKHLLIKQQYPKLDIRFVFQRSATKLGKGLKSTYAQWCDKHGFQYADKTIPQRWLDEITETTKA